MAEDKQWEIKVSVPMRLPVEQRQDLFAAVVGAVEAWEPAPAERDEWDADVAGCPADEWPEIVALASSRQAWAEEALRLDDAIKQTIARYEAQSQKAEDKLGDHPDALMAHACWNRAATWLRDAVNELPGIDCPGLTVTGLVCACPTDEQLSKLGSGFTRPQCTVHPETGGAA